MEEKLTPKLNEMLSDADRMLLEQKGIPEDSLIQNQEMYDWIGIQIDLMGEIKSSKISLPSVEQKDAALKAGYSMPVIVSGDLDIFQIGELLTAKAHSDKFKEETEDIPEFRYSRRPQYSFFDEKNEDVRADLAKLRSTARPQSCLFYIKPELHTDEAHPETQAKDLSEQLTILNKERAINPELNLRGLKSEEYILASILRYLRTGNPLDLDVKTGGNTRTYLLEDIIRNEQGDIIRCAAADKLMGIYEFQKDTVAPMAGARYGVFPKNNGNGSL